MYTPSLSHAEQIETQLPWTGGNPSEWSTNPQATAPANDPVRTLRRVESYLNDIKTMVMDFDQIDPAGEHAAGKLYIKRPGHMRWQYEPPTPILMISNGETITYYDYELDQKSYLPLDDSIVGLLSRPVIRFDDESLRVVNFREGADSIRFTLLRTGAPDEGSMTLVFSDKPLLLQEIIVADAMSQITQIKLKNHIIDSELVDSLFKFEDPRGLRTRHYRR